MPSLAQKQSFDYKLIAMCWHEASHAIVGTLNFLKVYKITVMGPESKVDDGWTHYFSYDENYNDDEEFQKILAKLHIQFYYAGLIGETLYYKTICGSSKFPMYLKSYSSFDTREASKLFRKYKLANPGKDTYNLKKDFKVETANMIFSYWNDIQLVAHCLYRKKRLNYDDMKFLLTRKSANKNYWKNIFSKINYIYDNIEKISSEEIKTILNYK